ncbi:CBS domain-containing membrane protein [Devosia crocina]|uniref:CBS domain-containing membrane protein n=1 Tax=Devosia crocina TaxID=429728 RepID=A0A1I7N1N8_9HYPH|nr:HPP family protein [Devosia crocina]SFV28570.1 CBS domain-containing membrane protein [Devosia crocina]
MIFSRFWSRLHPALVSVSPAERLRAAIGALLGILAIAGLGFLTAAHLHVPLLIAPLGASAVLLFAVPASPLAQPWAVLGGNGIAAAIGVTSALFVPQEALAAALALGAAILALLSLKCLHPPSGAVALTAAIGGPAIHDLGYLFVLWPVLSGSLALVLVATLYNRLTGKPYPHAIQPHLPTATPLPGGGLGVTVHDLASAIRERDEIVPVDPNDLEEVLQRAEILAFARRSGGVVAAAVMAQKVASVAPSTSLRVALRLLRSNGIKALPVVDAERRVVGILTQTDLLDKADWGPSATGSGLGWRLRSINNSDRPLRGKARDVMTPSVRTVLANTPIARIVQVMAETGHHHVPVVDAESRLVGMVTQSDVVAALFRVNAAELALSA